MVLADVAADMFLRRTGVKVMRVKALAVIIVLTLSAVAFVEFRKDNRADAAASNCYSDAQGPSTPTVCS